MTLFILTLAVFVLIILAVIWTHYFRGINVADESGNSSSQRDEANVFLYHEHKKEIEKDYANGGIDEENYQYLLAELEKSLLQDIAQNADEQAISQKTVNTMKVLWPVALSLFIFTFTVGLYVNNSEYSFSGTTAEINSQHSKNAQTGKKHEQLNKDEMRLVRIKTLQQKVDKDPQNTQNLYELGKVLIGAGDFDGAIIAFDRIIAIEGVKPDLLGAKVQASYYKNNRRLNASIQALIDQALALDPSDPSTNILLGMDSFINEDYAAAIVHFQRVIDGQGDNVNVVALTDAIRESKERLMLMGGENPGSVEQHSQQKNNPHDHAHDHGNEKHDEVRKPAIIEGPQLSLAVTLSDDILALLNQGEDKVLFVYATPADGRRMPLAAVKVKASDLPFEITLTNANAMSPQANLSSTDLVNIYAVVSMKGTVGIKSGDYKAEVLGVKVTKTELTTLTINTVVP